MVEKKTTSDILVMMSAATEMDILMASGANNEIQKKIKIIKNLSDNLKDSSIGTHANIILNFLNEKKNEMDLIHVQMRLDSLVRVLRHKIFDYYIAYEK